LVPSEPGEPPVSPQVPPVSPQVPPVAQATPQSSAARSPFRPEDDPPYRKYEAERRMTHPVGQWQDAPPSKWSDAIERYQARVKPGNQRALNPARGPFGWYLVHVHNRIHPIFVDEFLASLDKFPASERNQPQLVVRIEIALSGKDGSIVRIGVVRSSGVASFDAAALEAVDQAGPFGPPPANLLSSDGNVYFHWEFHRDPVFACSTINARPFLLMVE
jgi:TonB family protein